MVYSPQRRRDAETSAEILGTDGPVVEGDGQPESVILTRRRGDAEISAEKRRSQREDERGDSGGWWPSVWSGRVSAEILGTYDGNLGLDGCCLARRKRSPSSARIGRLKAAPPRLWGRALLMGMMAVALGAQSDGERQLETAVYREAVMGDVAAAIGMYRAILAQQGMARPVAARALWQLGQCQEKLGQRREAHATYARLAREYAAESGIAAQARGKLAGGSETPPGWFVPQVEKISGSLAELRRKGCRSNVGCAVVIAPATAAASDSVGNLMQSFRAAAYRGKTVRLRAWVRVEAGGPGDRAQMWLRVDRPNGKVGFLEDMDGRPVRAAEWTSCEIVAEIDSDAEFVDFGVRSMGRGRVWVDDVSFDIVPEEQVTAVRNAIARIYARTDATLAAFHFSGTEAVATARKATQQGGFTLVELWRDTWTQIGRA